MLMYGVRIRGLVVVEGYRWWRDIGAIRCWLSHNSHDVHIALYANSLFSCLFCSIFMKFRLVAMRCF
jgi:hypothetical protein